MKSIKKVGIMGGTFNPIHMGHLILAENAHEHLNLDEILFVPSGKPYMKEHVLDSKTRIHMTGIAIEDNPHFALSTIEVDRDGNSYSYETIKTLKENHPGTEYYFIIGADSLFVMDKWMHPELIFQQCGIAVVCREGYREKEIKEQINILVQKYQAKVEILPARSIDISSTVIRDRIRDKRSIRYMVPEKVRTYIEKNSIYSIIED